MMMNTASLRSPIVRQTIQAINDGRLDDFMALFASDATIVDGATYQGTEAMRDWAQRETFGVRMYVEVVQEKGKDGTTIEANNTSIGGYSGPGTFHFTIRGDLIERLVIS